MGIYGFYVVLIKLSLSSKFKNKKGSNLLPFFAKLIKTLSIIPV